jgi:hypothetical protein
MKRQQRSIDAVYDEQQTDNIGALECIMQIIEFVMGESVQERSVATNG